MACLARLKDDIKFLEATFVKKHPKFQIISATVDEINCCYISNNGDQHHLTANITVRILANFSYYLAKCFGLDCSDIPQLRIFFVAEILRIL